MILVKSNGCYSSVTAYVELLQPHAKQLSVGTDVRRFKGIHDESTLLWLVSRAVNNLCWNHSMTSHRLRISNLPNDFSVQPNSLNDRLKYSDSCQILCIFVILCFLFSIRELQRTSEMIRSYINPVEIICRCWDNPLQWVISVPKRESSFHLDSGGGFIVKLEWCNHSGWIPTFMTSCWVHLDWQVSYYYIIPQNGRPNCGRINILPLLSLRRHSTTNSNR